MTLPRRGTAVLGAFFVTFLWSSSWVLIKIGLEDISPLVFAGIRYVLAAIILSTRLFVIPKYRSQIRNLDRSWWGHLVIYGIFYYSITQGSQFVGLFYLPAITVSFLLNLTSIVVLFLGIILLREYPSSKQFGLILIGLLGIILFFYPINLPFSQLLGLIVVCFGVIANALSSVIGRSLNQRREISSYVITTLSMLIGSVILLVAALYIEGIPELSLKIIFLILWLAIINTSLAFVIWNYTLQELKAIESSIINSTMLPQITFLAIIFFGESLIFKEWIGLILIFITGILISVLRKDTTSVEDDTVNI